MPCAICIASAVISALTISSLSHGLSMSWEWQCVPAAADQEAADAITATQQTAGRCCPARPKSGG